MADFEFSVSWRLASGIVYSYVESLKTEVNRMGNEIVLPLFEDFHGKRLPAQHQLNASAIYHLRPTQKRAWTCTLGLSLFNIYRQQNIYSRDFSINTPRMAPPEVEYLDRVDLGFTPNAVLRFEW